MGTQAALTSTATGDVMRLRIPQTASVSIRQAKLEADDSLAMQGMGLAENGPSDVWASSTCLANPT